MLNLIHNLRFDRSRKEPDFSFKKNLGNLTTSELENTYTKDSLSNKFLSSEWLSIYRRQ